MRVGSLVAVVIVALLPCIVVCAKPDGNRDLRQVEVDDMVTNILHWLQGVYKQNNRKARQGSREYLPPLNQRPAERPRPFQPPSSSSLPTPPPDYSQSGYPLPGPSPQPPYTEGGYQPGTPPQPGYQPSFPTYIPPSPTTQPPYQPSSSPNPSTGYPAAQPGYNPGYPSGPPQGGYPSGPPQGPSFPPSQPPSYPSSPSQPPSYQPDPSGPAYQPGTSTPGLQPGPSSPGYQPGPSDPGNQPGPSSPGYQPGPSSPGFQPEPSNPVYLPGPSDPGNQPGPSSPGYQPGPSSPGYQPDPISPGYQPGPSDPGNQAGPSSPGYQPGPSSPGYQPGSSSPGSQPGPSNPPSSPGYQPNPTEPSNNPTQPPSYPSSPSYQPGPSSPAPGPDPNDDRHPPHIHAIEVQCAKDQMTINIEFNKVYNGIIYSKGFFNNPNCIYVRENSNQIKYTFTVNLNMCGTEFINGFDTQGQSYLENVLVLQNEAGIQEIWDSVRSVRCLWEGNLQKQLTTALSVGMLNQEIVNFSGDTAMASLDIQMGRGPFAPQANGLIKIGETMTLVISVTGDPGFDIQVKDCKARDAASKNVVALTDENGCVLKPKLFGAFQKTRETGNTGASILAFAFFNAFKFPDEMDLILECNVELCKTNCEMCPSPQSLEPARRRKRDVFLVGDNSTLIDPVLVGRGIRVILPEDLAVQEPLNLCMSYISFVWGGAFVLMVMTASSITAGYLWLKLQKFGMEKK